METICLDLMVSFCMIEFSSSKRVKNKNEFDSQKRHSQYSVLIVLSVSQRTKRTMTNERYSQKESEKNITYTFSSKDNMG